MRLHHRRETSTLTRSFLAPGLTALTLPLLLIGAGTQAHANIITSCVNSFSVNSTLNSCTFTPAPTTTGTLSISETFNSASGQLNVGLFLTNTIAGNNTTGVIDYTVTKDVLVGGTLAMSGFAVNAPNASALGSVTVTGLTSCTVAGLGFTCSGGSVAVGNHLIMTFHLSTPTDQTAGAFALFESGTAVPEPGGWATVAAGLVLLGLYRRKNGVRV